jgi:hypothetical protein
MMENKVRAARAVVARINRELAHGLRSLNRRAVDRNSVSLLFAIAAGDGTPITAVSTNGGRLSATALRGSESFQFELLECRLRATDGRVSRLFLLSSSADAL